MAVEIRPAAERELGDVAAVLRAAGLGANVGRLLEYPRASPTGESLRPTWTPSAPHAST